jgi:hypothetical protein
MLIRVLCGNIAATAQVQSAMERDLARPILDIPWFDTGEPDLTVVEQLELNDWGPIIQADEFRVFHSWRFHSANIRYDKPFREFLPWI